MTAPRYATTGPRVANSNARAYVQARQPFEGNNTFARLTFRSFDK